MQYWSTYKRYEGHHPALTPCPSVAWTSFAQWQGHHPFDLNSNCTHVSSFDPLEVVNPQLQVGRDVNYITLLFRVIKYYMRYRIKRIKSKSKSNIFNSTYPWSDQGNAIFIEILWPSNPAYTRWFNVGRDGRPTLNHHWPNILGLLESVLTNRLYVALENQLSLGSSTPSSIELSGYILWVTVCFIEYTIFLQSIVPYCAYRIKKIGWRKHEKNNLADKYPASLLMVASLLETLIVIFIRARLLNQVIIYCIDCDKLF